MPAQDPGSPIVQSFELTPQELAHYASERRRTRGFFRTGPGMGAIFIAGVAFIAVDGLFSRGSMLTGAAVSVAAVLAVVAMVVYFVRRPERAPLVSVLEGTVVYSQDDGETYFWFVGDQRVSFAPHWARYFETGTHRRVRVATPPGERVGVVVAVDGLASATFERDGGLRGWPTLHPGLLVGIVTAAFATAFSLLNLLTFSADDVTIEDGLNAIPAAFAPEAAFVHAPAVLSDALDSPRAIRITKATLVPTDYVRNAPPEAAWVLIHDATRAHWIEQRKALAEAEEEERRQHRELHGPRRITQRKTVPIHLAPGDAVAFVRRIPGEELGESGRPGDQVMLWLAREREFVGVRFRGESGPPWLLWPEARANALSLGGISTLLGVVSGPALGLLLLVLGIRLSQRRRFGARVARHYASASPRALAIRG